MLVISIEPGSLFICEQVADHCRSIDVAERQVLETQPRTEFIGTGIHAEEQALVPDAVHTFPVNTRFIGRYHPREKRLGIEIVPDFLRAFMDIQEKAYSMSGAVPEITLVFDIGCEIEDWNSIGGSLEGDGGEGGSGEGGVSGDDGKVYTDLSDEGTANCYLVSGAGDYKFKAVIGNTDGNVGNVKSVEVLWESFGTDVMPEVGSLIDSVSYRNGYVRFSTPETFANGNAVIAARNSKGNILWSWHIWCSEEGWQEQVYLNDAGTMMDRNLGATSATPGSVGALGLLYQWGRKDPFLGSSSISNSVQAVSTGTWSTSSTHITNVLAIMNPTVFFTGAYNYLPDGNWSSNKTAYDPCPVGWRVPEGGDEGIWKKAGFANTSFDLTNHGIAFDIADGGKTWYPTSGTLAYGDGVLRDSHNDGYFWSHTHATNFAYSLHFNSYGGVHPSSDIYRSNGYAVRCLKE